jgi:endonuclease/exonuclease/phosphatase family metal-dependent hydrolase
MFNLEALMEKFTRMIKIYKPLLALTLICCSASSNAQSLKVMTYNLRLDLDSDGENSWTNRKVFLESQIQFYEPDIFGVQEAKPNQVIDLENALPQYAYVGIGREGIGKGESSNIYFKKEEFKLIQENTFWLSETPNEVSKGWDAACHRVCTYALLENKQNKVQFWVFNTHLDHVGDLARTNGIRLILSKINSLNTKNIPVIFMGDFNSEPKEDRIIELKKQMIDTRDVSIEKPFGPSGTFNGFKFNEPVKTLIDYIFISKDSPLKVKKYAVLSDSKDLKYPSDHLPVYVEIMYK